MAGRFFCMWIAILCLHNIAVVSAIDFRIVDLTHELSDDTIYWPGNPSYNFTILSREKLANFWYENNYIGQAEHGGTHLDAPSHFYEGKWRTHQIPIDRLVGPGVIVDIKGKAESNPDYRVQVQDIVDWENANGEIPDKAAVIMNSGWGDKYPNKTAVFGTESPDDPSTFHFPAWHEDTVIWLMNNRNIRILGVDTPSTDYGQSTMFPVHIILANTNLPGLENVAYLDSLPAAGSYIFAPVIKTRGGSGGSARIFATVFTPLECVNSGTAALPSLVLYLVLGCMKVGKLL